MRAGIWRRNGPGMSDQVLNYSEPPFCRPLVDVDVLLLQFALIWELVMPWTYSPTQDPTTHMNLVEELLHLVIILITVRTIC